MQGIPAREVKDLQFNTDARTTVLAGVEKLYQAVASTYGPAANNVLQGMPYGDPVLTRDGVTVAKRVILDNRAENDAASVMRQASEKTNKTAGDGTTATIVLGYNLLKAAHQRVVAGENPMRLKKQMVEDSRKVIEYIKGQSIPVGKHLQEVTTVSSGDPAIGALVADMLADVGADGGITIREQSYPTVDVEKINGYYFDRGFYALNQQVEWEKPNILVTQKPLTAVSDMAPIIQLTNQQPEKRLVIIGEVRGEALQLLLLNSATQVSQSGQPVPFEGLVIPPPMYGQESKLFMEDIATYVGSKVFVEGEKDITPDHFGASERVQANQDRAILFTGSGKADAISDRAATIKQQIDKETNPHAKDQLESRYSKLVGKIAIVNVGAATETEMEELRFRVEDAIEAGKSALKDGIVPGGATMLVHAAERTNSKYRDGISSLFAEALLNTFKKLYENAGEPADYRLKQVEKSALQPNGELKPGKGFNLRDMTEEPIDLAKAGIWDATRAVTQTIENATSAAGALLTVGALVTPRDDEPTA